VKPDRNDSTFVTQHNFADPGAIARVILKTPFIRDLKTEWVARDDNQANNAMAA